MQAKLATLSSHWNIFKFDLLRRPSVETKEKFSDLISLLFCLVQTWHFYCQIWATDTRRCNTHLYDSNGKLILEHLEYGTNWSRKTLWDCSNVIHLRGLQCCFVIRFETQCSNSTLCYNALPEHTLTLRQRLSQKYLRSHLFISK